MKRRIILIIGILVALTALWFSVRSQPLLRNVIKTNHLSAWFKTT
ncbi:MAG TPA: hypothetical protein VI583_04650 [Cyclobacteriaceae bacterium]|nr:hypothetical protein [Cyclobacteriaceae bacterium]